MEVRQEVLDGECVDDRGEHSHLVALTAFETGRRALHAPEDVAAADDHRHLHAGIHRRFDFVGVMHNVIVTYTISIVARQRLTTQFQQYAFVLHIPKNQVAKIHFFRLDSFSLSIRIQKAKNRRNNSFWLQ